MGALARGRALSFLGAWRALPRPAFQGTFSACQTRGHRGEARSTLVLLSGVSRFLLHAPLYLINFPLPLVQTKSNAACAPGALRPMRPCWVHPCNFFARGWRELGDQRPPPPTTSPTAQLPAGTEIPAGAAEKPSPGCGIGDCEHGPRCGHSMGPSVPPPARRRAGPRAPPQWAGPLSCALRQSAAPPPPLRFGRLAA